MTPDVSYREFHIDRRPQGSAMNRDPIVIGWHDTKLSLSVVQGGEYVTILCVLSNTCIS